MSTRLYTRNIVRLLLGSLVLVSLAACGDETPVDPGDDNNGGSGNGPDTVPPSAITDLRLRAPTQSTVALVWLAPGDDGQTGQADRYDIRRFSATITESNWQDAIPVNDAPPPSPGGQLETFVVKGLASGADHYFAIKTIDEADNESALSNCASGTTISETTPPDPVQDLDGYAISDTDFQLTWTATGDDRNEGTATAYDIRYSIKPITGTNFGSANQLTGEPAPQAAGEAETFVATGLTPEFNYYFAMKTVDDEDNWSGLSNTCLGLGVSEYLMADPQTIPPELWTVDVQIKFRTNSEAETVEIIIYKMVWDNGVFVPQAIRHLLSGNFPAGVHRVYWDWRMDNGQIFPMCSWCNLTVKLFLDGLEVDDAPLRGSQ